MRQIRGWDIRERIAGPCEWKWAGPTARIEPVPQRTFPQKEERDPDIVYGPTKADPGMNLVYWVPKQNMAGPYETGQRELAATQWTFYIDLYTQYSYSVRQELSILIYVITASS